MEDVTILSQFNSTLQDIIGYENFTHGGEFISELANIFEKYEGIVEGLMNLTMEAGETIPCSGEMDPLSPPPTTDQVRLHPPALSPLLFLLLFSSLVLAS